MQQPAHISLSHPKLPASLLAEKIIPDHMITFEIIKSTVD